MDGKREWLTYSTQAVDDSDFVTLGNEYEQEINLKIHHIGNAEIRLLAQRPLVDWATDWMGKFRA
ncbi:Aminoglycoside 3-N-acetyltransferase [compost metagenome]